MRGLTRGGGSFKNIVLAKESGRGGGTAASPALLAAFANTLRSAASCVIPSSAACLNRLPVGEKSSRACTLSNMIVPLSHLHGPDAVA